MTANTSANTADAEEKTPSSSTAEPEIEKAPQEEEKSAPNAFLAFMDAHDQRARRIKKP